jgi:hypothetical protein
VAAKGAAGVRLWLSEGIVEDVIRVITGRWKQRPDSQPLWGPSAPVCHRKNLGWFRSVASKGSMDDFSAAINLGPLQLLGSQPAAR